jgi:ABC-2 type transport system permease protein
MTSQVRAILWAQWRSLWHVRTPYGVGGRVLTGVAALLWYGLWAAAAWAALLVTSAAEGTALRAGLAWGALAVTAYWQIAPVASAKLGAALDTKRLLVYPIAERGLFALETLLRASAALEMLLVVAGSAAGLLANPAVAAWRPLLAVPLFVLFNLFAAVGLKNVIERLARFRRVRELFIFLVVLAAGLPQLIAVAGVPPAIRRALEHAAAAPWPWTTAARLVAGEAAAAAVAGLAAWVAAAFLFGAWQFRRSLRGEAEAMRAVRTHGQTGAIEAAYRLPALIFRDPLAALVEKELRTLARSPRFRLLFAMGFSFGFLIWLPLLRQHTVEGARTPVMVSGYAMFLLAEAVFWNMFGYDRSAARMYFLAPVPFRRVLLGKNLAALVFVVLEACAVLAVSRLAGLRVDAAVALETGAVTLVLSLYLLAAGNLSSIRYPRPVDPGHSWGRMGRSRFQIMLVLLFPVLLFPVLLAYAARYAFQSDAVFYVMLALAGGLGGFLYRLSRESAAATAERDVEMMLDALTETSGPIAAD